MTHRAHDVPRRALLMVVAIAFGGALSAGAQDRMPPIAAERMTEAQRQAAEEFKAARGTEPSGPFVPLMRSPDVMSRARAMGDYLRYKSALPPRLSEFLILITARHWTQQYEWDVHYPFAMRAGLNPDIAKAVADGRRPDGMAEDEDILYALCMELQQNRSVSDATYARAVSRFGERGIIDAVGIVGYYNLLAMVLNTARTPLPANVTPALAPFPR